MHTSYHFYIAFGTKFHSVFGDLGAALSWSGPSPEGPKPNVQRTGGTEQTHASLEGFPQIPIPSNSSGALESCPRYCQGHETVFYALPPRGRQVRGGAWRAHTQGTSPAGAWGRRVDLSGGAFAQCFAWPLWRWVNRRGGPGTRQTRRASTL
jgi:hypothetical protein